VLPHPDLLAFERMLDAIVDDADKAVATMGPPLDRDGNQIRDVTTGASSGNSMAGTRSSPAVDFQQVIAAGRNYAGSATNETKQTLSSLSAAITSFNEVPGGRKLVI